MDYMANKLFMLKRITRPAGFGSPAWVLLSSMRIQAYHRCFLFHAGHFLSTKYHSRSRLRQHDQMPEGLRSHTEESETERSSPKFPRALRDDVQVPRAKTFRPEYSLIRRLASALQERYQRDEEDLWTAEEDPQLEDSENQDIEKESITDHYYDHSSPLYLIRKWYNRIESD